MGHPHTITQFYFQFDISPQTDVPNQKLALDLHTVAVVVCACTVYSVQCVLFTLHTYVPCIQNISIFHVVNFILGVVQCAVCTEVPVFVCHHCLCTGIFIAPIATRNANPTKISFDRECDLYIFSYLVGIHLHIKFEIVKYIIPYASSS